MTSRLPVKFLLYFRNELHEADVHCATQLSHIVHVTLSCPILVMSCISPMCNSAQSYCLFDPLGIKASLRFVSFTDCKPTTVHFYLK